MPKPRAAARQSVTAREDRPKWIAIRILRSEAAPGYDGLTLLAELGDPEPHGVAGGEVDRLGLAAHANAGRGSRRDDVTGLQSHEVTDIAHERGDGKDHGPRVAGLHSFPVDVEPHVEALNVADLVAGHEPGPHGTEGIAPLALVPGSAALRLKFALG